MQGLHDLVEVADSVPLSWELAVHLQADFDDVLDGEGMLGLVPLVVVEEAQDQNVDLVLREIVGLLTVERGARQGLIL